MEEPKVKSQKEDALLDLFSDASVAGRQPATSSNLLDSSPVAKPDAKTEAPMDLLVDSKSPTTLFEATATPAAA